MSPERNCLAFQCFGVNRDNKPIPEGIAKPDFVFQDLTGLQNILSLSDETGNIPK